MNACGERMLAAAPRPKSPPGYADLYGKRRHLAKIHLLEREITFLQEELKSVELLQPASRCCRELSEFVDSKPDPLIAVRELEKKPKEHHPPSLRHHHSPASKLLLLVGGSVGQMQKRKLLWLVSSFMLATGVVAAVASVVVVGGSSLVFPNAMTGRTIAPVAWMGAVDLLVAKDNIYTSHL